MKFSRNLAYCLLDRLVSPYMGKKRVWRTSCGLAFFSTAVCAWGSLHLLMWQRPGSMLVHGCSKWATISCRGCLGIVTLLYLFIYDSVTCCTCKAKLTSVLLTSQVILEHWIHQCSNRVNLERCRWTVCLLFLYGSHRSSCWVQP